MSVPHVWEAVPATTSRATSEDMAGFNGRKKLRGVGSLFGASFFVSDASPRRAVPAAAARVCVRRQLGDVYGMEAQGRAGGLLLPGGRQRRSHHI